MVKRLFVIVISIVMVFALASCAKVKSDIDISNDVIDSNNPEEDIEVEGFEKALYEKVKNEILSWNEDDIYAISFFVDSNGAYEYKGYENVSMWAISYNTEEDCDGADELDEER